MKTYAQDPIDYIRDFRFAIFKSNPGSSKGPTCKDQDLVIRLTDAEDRGVVEVMVIKANRRAAKYVADLLAKQPFYVFPFAELVVGESSTWINLQIVGNNISFVSLKAQLHALIGHVSEVGQTIRSVDRAKIIPPAAERVPTGGPGYGQQPTLGQQQTFDSRSPGQDSRTPQYWNQSGGTNNNDNW